jgi:hypothetical protein
MRPAYDLGRADGEAFLARWSQIEELAAGQT